MARQPINKVAREIDRDNFMDAQKAMSYGLVDKVITNAS
ncbi:ATP-dependent Clp protease proteolytic subunit [Paenibacillus sp. LPE1-1-1.1]